MDMIFDIYEPNPTFKLRGLLIVHEDRREVDKRSRLPIVS